MPEKYCGLCRWFRELKSGLHRCEWHEFRRDRYDKICVEFEGYADKDELERKVQNDS